MRIDVLTIFPEVVSGFATASVVGRGIETGLLEVNVHDLRAATTDKHRTVDGPPFGGGAGMVMRPEPIFDTVAAVQPPRPLLYLSPTGRPFDQGWAADLAELDGFTLLCGRYEGIDQRVRDQLVDAELSVGDYVLAGGEVAAAVVIEAVARLVPGVLGNESSATDESFSDGLLEYPHYTRPAEYLGHEVPAVLRSGNHAAIERWRRAKALERTLAQRPDLIEDRGGLSAEDQALLDELNAG